MKNLVIAIILVIAAYLIYTQMNSADQPAQVAAPSEATTGVVQDTAIEETPAMPDSLISNSPPGASVFIIQPINGSTVSSPVTVKFGIENMVVAPAGDDQPNSGHHHLLIDLEEMPDMRQPLPANDNLIHFGGGQTETTVELEPGMHTLQLLLGNYLHIPHSQPVMSDKIVVIVE